MARSRIKGITIEIDGSITGLDKALKDTNKKLGETKSSLNDVNRLLKLDPKNVELLKQKQDLLKKAVEETKSKLDTEKEALSQLKNADQTPEVKKQMEALERQIVADEQALEKLKKESKDFGSVAKQQFQAVGDKVKEIGSKMTDVGKELTTKVTAPIAGVAVASVAAWKEVDEALDTVTKKTGASGKTLEDMQKSAKNLAETIPTSFQTAGEAIGEVNTRFGLTGQALEDLSGKFIKFADLNDTDVSSSIDNVQSVMAAWNVDTQDAGLLLDTLTKAGQDTGVSVDELTNQLVTNKTALADMGFSISDSAMFLANLSKNGIDTSTVLTGMKKALVNAAKEGKTMDQALAELQTTIGDSTNKTEAYQAAMELFGNKAGPAIADAVMQGKLSFEDLSTSLQDYAGTVDKTFEETLDPLDKMQTTMNTLKDLGAELVETAAPMIQAAMEKLRDVVQELKDKWDNLSPGTQEAIEKAAMIAAAVGPLIMIIGGIATGIGSIIAALGLLMSPITLIVVGIAGLVAAGVILIKNWDKIKESANQLKEKIGEKWDNIKQKTAEAWENIKTAMSNKADAMKQAASDKFDSIKDKASTAFDNVKNAITEKIEAAKEKVSGIVETIKGLFSFDWQLPDLKLPHIFVGSYINVPLLGTIPDPMSISVEWYKKAYDNPVMFTSPTVLQTPYGLKGFGDGSGGEIVLSEDKLRELVGAGDIGVVNHFYLNGRPLTGFVIKEITDIQRGKSLARGGNANV